VRWEGPRPWHTCTAYERVSLGKGEVSQCLLRQLLGAVEAAAQLLGAAEAAQQQPQPQIQQLLVLLPPPPLPLPLPLPPLLPLLLPPPWPLRQCCTAT
jgi:hypothetical protein